MQGQDYIPVLLLDHFAQRPISNMCHNNTEHGVTGEGLCSKHQQVHMPYIEVPPSCSIWQAANAAQNNQELWHVPP